MRYTLKNLNKNSKMTQFFSTFSTVPFENFFNNCSFFLLLCSMCFYWIRAFLNMLIFSNFGKIAILGANLSMFFLLIYRSLVENHFALSNHATHNDPVLETYKSY